MARRFVRHRGWAAVAIDGPVHGDRGGGGLAEFNRAWRDDPGLTDAMVADWRATLDAVQSQPEVGQGPVGWWGLSMGSILGLPVVAAEPRIRVAVLGLVGLVTERLGAAAAAATCPILFLCQWDDELFPRDRVFELFGALASTDKRMHVHPGGHVAVPAEAFEASEAFLAGAL
jgi:dienelactone hydrolase